MIVALRPPSIADTLSAARARVRDCTLVAESEVLPELIASIRLSPGERTAITARAEALVTALRGSRPAPMDLFFASFGLATPEGRALMGLAEALLRVPDRATADHLIADTLHAADWSAQRPRSGLVRLGTLGLSLAARWLDPAASAPLRLTQPGVRPLVRTAARRAMRVLGRQFVLGETVAAALRRVRRDRTAGVTHSFDMLGEAARTQADADAYFRAYADAITALARGPRREDWRDNPGISIKLSALHPRYEETQAETMRPALIDRVARLVRQARAADLGFTIDAEEADRLELSLDVAEAVLADPALDGWDGFGFVVQAYGKRAPAVIDWLATLAQATGRRIAVRLVKGAYWDMEIKRAQTLGLAGFPVFTDKAATDVSYLACARRLVDRRDVLFPQFATHNAHTVAAVLAMAGEERDGFELQRLHGMGHALHTHVRRTEGTRLRVYAPVGPHRELLAYLVRRMLENGANASFVHQIADAAVPAAEVAADPIALVEARSAAGRDPAPTVLSPADLYRPDRRNAAGIDLADRTDWQRLERERSAFAACTWTAAPILAGPGAAAGPARVVVNPARPADRVGMATDATVDDVDRAIAAAARSRDWSGRSAADRAAPLRAAADLYEANRGELLACLAREAGKTLPDAVAEWREAVDFLRFYAAEAVRLGDAGTVPRGPVACISPWNFPLAIFTGQIAAVLAAGNPVLAKPAEQTPLIAATAVRLLHRAGVPADALQLLPGDGATIGAALTRDPRLRGVGFTGSTETAKRIGRAMAEHLPPDAPLVAETGGINAMVVDSTALPEQAVRDIVASAFQSAGQRCSALRVLYVQEDGAEPLLTMLMGAMDTLTLGDPWRPATDIGPVIDADAKAAIEAHIDLHAAQGRVLKRLPAPADGHFVGPALIRVDGIDAVTHEVFGPVLHVATFAADRLDRVVAAINGTGYGLTFGLHSRIGRRIDTVTGRIRAGNAYVNRNQIGAVVGSQPFGGEGLSGTGPKAGGPGQLGRWRRRMASAAAPSEIRAGAAWSPAAALPSETVQAALTALPRPAAPAPSVADLPGPTGEANRLRREPRGPVLCLGPSADRALAQADRATALGCPALAVAPDLPRSPGRLAGTVTPETVTALTGLAAIMWEGDVDTARALRRALAARDGAILPLVQAGDDPAERLTVERHVCIDLTAAGGNADLLAGSRRA